jgi:hypothetical protein
VAGRQVGRHGGRIERALRGLKIDERRVPHAGRVAARNQCRELIVIRVRDDD